LVNAERYEVLIDRKLKQEFVNTAHDYSRGPAELVRDFMRAFVKAPVKLQQVLMERRGKRSKKEADAVSDS